jgi:hypothetical protein
MFSAKNNLSYPSGKIFSDSDIQEGFPNNLVVDPKPLPEETVTVKYANIKRFFNRSYIEAATIGAGSIAVLVMVFKHSGK